MSAFYSMAFRITSSEYLIFPILQTYERYERKTYVRAPLNIPLTCQMRLSAAYLLPLQLLQNTRLLLGVCTMP